LGGFSLFFIGLANATPSSAAIVQQISIPLTTFLGVIFLGERVGPRRISGTALAMTGIVIVVAKPDSLSLSTGLLWIAASALTNSVAIILIKKIETLEPARLQSWVGACAILPSLLLASAFDTAPWQRSWQAGWPLVAASLYSAIVVSIVAQGINYRLVHRNHANVMAPLMVMAPLFTIVLGHFITHDPLTPAILIGGAITIAGVMVVSYRRRPVLTVPEIEVA
jgi:O-acetylserine/cysteine efflux transporter